MHGSTERKEVQGTLQRPHDMTLHGFDQRLRSRAMATLERFGCSLADSATACQGCNFPNVAATSAHSCLKAAQQAVHCAI